jgi:spore coat polysaccharide biosynthesis predicted glycosyltransferase SpsG
VITVLADAGPTVGLGHLSRAGAVVAALRVQGHEAQTYVLGGLDVERDGILWEPVGDSAVPGHGPLLVDSYRVDVDALGDAGRPVATFWDGLGHRPSARLTIAFTDPHGPAHACLRPMFWGVPARPPAPRVRRVLVAAGGGATGGLDALAAAVRDAAPEAEVAALVGPYADVALPAGVAELRAPARMVDALQEADLVVTAAGQTMLEALCTGTPTVAVAVVDNQEAQLDVVRRAGAAAAPALDGVADAVRALVDDTAQRERLALAGRRLVDGFGALRVAGLLATLGA